MIKYYAFLRKLHDGNWEILEIRPLSQTIDDILKLKEYDTAFPISNSAVVLYNEVLVSINEILRVKKEFNRKEITEEDFIIIDLKKIKERSKELNSKKKIVKDEDLINEEIFEKAKTEILRKTINRWFPKINLYSIMSFIEYIDLNNFFVSKGYYITDENKEDIFIEIIEKNEEDILNKLENLLAIKQELLEFKTNYSLYFRLKEELDYLSFWDFESIDEALSELNQKVIDMKNENILNTTSDEYKKLIEDVKQAYIVYKKSDKIQKEIEDKIVKIQSVKDKMYQIFGTKEIAAKKLESFFEEIDELLGEEK